MSGGSASRHSKDGPGLAPATGRSNPQPDAWLERLTGVGSSKPSFYAEWRRTSRGLDRAIEASKAILAAVDAASRGPPALCRAVLEAVGDHFGALEAALVFTGEHVFAGRLPGFVIWPQAVDASRAVEPPPELGTVASRAMAGGTIVLVSDRKALGGLRTSVGVPMRGAGGPIGTLVIRLPDGAVDDSDLAILQALAGEIAVGIENACLHEESDRLGDRLTSIRAEASRHIQELEERNRQLQRARLRLAESRWHQLIGRERNRIARELHDTVVQYLVSIGMNLEWCRQQEAVSSEVRERVSVSKELARSALLHIRSSIFELGSLDGARSGLVPALRDLAEEFRAMVRLPVKVRTRGHPGPLPASVEHAVFRIAQEALWNVVKHAEASRAWVDLERGADTVRLSVSDDGTGDAGAIRRYLEQASGRRSPHHRGLANIRGRTHEVRGELRVARRRGGGVRLVVVVPLDETETDA